jgi:16S rRNA (uracil1498-N3)-methyltransferase
VGAVPADGGPLAYVDDLDAPVLSEGDHHHLARVRRVRDGDALIVGDGAGRWRRARFAGVTPEPVGGIEGEPAAAPRLGVAFALVKGAKPELVVQKLVELGIDDLRPFVAARSVVRWDEHKADAALERWRRVAVEAAMQSRRAWLPDVHPVVSFDDVAALPGACRADRPVADAADGGSVDGPSLDHPLVLVGP